MDIILYKREFIRDRFDCGKSSLNNYILRNATDDVQQGACTCFVIANENNEIIGYYTLNTGSIAREDIPGEFRGRIRYEDIPIVLLGRLAVDKRYRRQGIGERLLIDALYKCMTTAKDTIGARAVVVDPIDEDAVAFYEKYGFQSIPDSGKMFITIRKIETSLNTSGK